MVRRFLYRNWLKIKNYHFRYSKRKNNVFIHRKASGFINVNFEGKNGIPEGCHFFGNVKIGYATTLGKRNYLGGDISIGKYCQLGSDVSLHSTNHPINYLSTYINKNLFNGELNKLKETNKKINIGNDVWVGHGVIILGGVSIGNGAILAAGSVVTKSVEPYTIVAGVPAKPIENRFSSNVIKEIEDLKWWDLSEDELKKVKPLFFKNFKDENSIY